MTVLLCCNKSSSHKLVIGKFGKPRCFHHINMNVLPALYRHSKNAWMTSSIFEDWFHEEFVPSVRRHLRHKKMESKAILLMDHCPAHPGVESLTSLDYKIKAVFLIEEYDIENSAIGPGYCCNLLTQLPEKFD